jgi:hypothetical protein
MSVSEKRMERVMRLVKLGPPIPTVPGAYALLVEGRPTYGTNAYYRRNGGSKALIYTTLPIERNGDVRTIGVDHMMDHNGEGLAYWRPVHPKLEAMIMLSLMGKVP